MQKSKDSFANVSQQLCDRLLTGNENRSVALSQSIFSLIEIQCNFYREVSDLFTGLQEQLTLAKSKLNSKQSPGTNKSQTTAPKQSPPTQPVKPSPPSPSEQSKPPAPQNTNFLDLDFSTTNSFSSSPSVPPKHDIFGFHSSDQPSPALSTSSSAQNLIFSFDQDFMNGATNSHSSPLQSNASNQASDIFADWSTQSHQTNNSSSNGTKISEYDFMGTTSTTSKPSLPPKTTPFSQSSPTPKTTSQPSHVPPLKPTSQPPSNTSSQNPPRSPTSPSDANDFQAHIRDQDQQDKLFQEARFENEQLITAKVEKWTAGKKSNLRSLLSTFHEVLWEDSGWTSVSISDLFSESDLKKAQRKAMLVVHPDKMRDKPLEQQLLAERLFEILKEAK